MTFLWFPFSVILSTSTARAACPTPTTDHDILVHTQAAFVAVDQMEADALKAESAATQDALRCLQKPVSPTVAVQTHQIAGLQMRSEDGGRVERMRTAFASARLIDPQSTLPQSIAPGPEVALYSDYSAIPLETLVTTALPEPRNGNLYINGSPSAQIPMTWPTIVQYEDKNGEITFTQYHLPGEPIRFYPNRRSYRGPRTLSFISLGMVGASAALLIPASYHYLTYTLEADGSYSDYFADHIQWRQRIGFPLLAAGGAGLLGGIVWATQIDGDILMGTTARW